MLDSTASRKKNWGWDSEEIASAILGGVQLKVRVVFLAIGVLLLLNSMMAQLWGNRGDTVERRFLRSAGAMARRRVPPRKGPLEEAAFEPGSLISDVPLVPAPKRRTAASVRAAAHNGTVECQRLLWVVGYMGAATTERQQQMQAALLSVRRHAPSLVPVLVHSGQPDAGCKWWAAAGGFVLQHNLSFLPLLERQQGAHLGELLEKQGGYLRLDLPRIVDRLKVEARGALQNTSTSYALVTDQDVMFLGGGPAGGSHPGDLSTCTVPPPELMMVGREKVDGSPWDTGVLLVNVTALRLELPAILKFGEAAQFNYPGWDQGLINAYLRQQTPALELLPNRLSHKGYWGSSANATLMHWLGAKPHHVKCLRCYLANHSKGVDWARKCPCSVVPYKALFTQAPDGGKMYAQALAAFDGYVQRAAMESILTSKAGPETAGMSVGQKAESTTSSTLKATH